MIPSLLEIVALGANLVDASAINRQAASVTFTDTYDALTTGSDVNLLHGLEYTGATVAAHHFPNGTVALPIVPQSKPKYTSSSQPVSHFSSSAVSSDTYITLNAATNVSSFDLYHLYFACVASDGGAEPCTLAVYGVGDGVREYSSTFDYAPSSTQDAPMAMAQFNYPAFRQIQNVSIGIVTGSAPAGKTVLVVDSLDHINYA